MRIERRRGSGPCAVPEFASHNVYSGIQNEPLIKRSNSRFRVRCKKLAEEARIHLD